MLTTMLVAAAIGLAAFIGLAYRAGWTWTGFVGTQPKTLWDWLLLLLVPAGLAVVVFALNDAQNGRERRRSEHEAARARAVEADRRHAARLDAYLAQMTDLMLRHKLTRAGLDNPVSRIASTLTATVLTELDGRRKGQVLVFLNTARLLHPRHPHMDLGHADFRRMDARDLSFPESMTVVGADFRHANFDRALLYLDGETPGHHAGPISDFSKTKLQDATFRHATMRGSFKEADLDRADFSGADLDGLDFEAACLDGTRFTGARIRDLDLEDVRGDGIDLSRVRLHWTTEWRDLHDFQPPTLRAIAGQRHAHCLVPEPFPQAASGR